MVLVSTDPLSQPMSYEEALTEIMDEAGRALGKEIEYWFRRNTT